MRKRRGVALGAALVIFAATSPPAAAADGPGDTTTLPCRPTIACTAEIVPPGAFELEAGYQYKRLADNERQSSFPFLAKLSLAKWLQLQLGGNGFTAVEGSVATHYLDDVSIGAKFPLVAQAKLTPAISFSVAASVPTFDAAGYVRSDDVLMVGYITKDIGPLHADLNLGLNRLGVEAADPHTQEWVALALSVALSAPFVAMAESYYFTDAMPIAAHDGGFLFALSHAPRPWLVFDVGGDVGYVSTTRAFSAFFGMSIVPFLLWRKAP